jgi:hypothetical protein
MAQNTHGYWTHKPKKRLDLAFTSKTRLVAERGLVPIDSEWLVLRIDGAGRVDDVKIVRD